MNNELDGREVAGNYVNITTPPPDSSVRRPTTKLPYYHVVIVADGGEGEAAPAPRCLLNCPPLRDTQHVGHVTHGATAPSAADASRT